MEWNYFSGKFAIWRYLAPKSSKNCPNWGFWPFCRHCIISFPDFVHNDWWELFLVVFLQLGGPVNAFLFLWKNLKRKNKKLALTLFCYLCWDIWLGNSKKFIFIDQLRFYIFSHPRKFKNVVKYCSFFNNKLPVSWVLHIARDLQNLISYIL